MRTGGFIRFCSGHLGGQLGCELWFKLGFTIFSTADKVCDFKEDRFSLLHADPRRIFVKFCQGRLSLVFASLHAPHRAVEAHLIADWWAETCNLCRVSARDSFLVLAGDLNACLGSILSPSVGAAAPEPEDFAGSELHAVAQRLHLWLPCTFEECHWGDSWTYRHKNGGKLTRIDYVLLPIEWRQAITNTWTDPSIHSGQLVIDHVASVLDVTAQVLASSCTPSGARRRPKIDERALVKPENQAAVRCILEEAPRIPWGVSAHAHAAAPMCPG